MAIVSAELHLSHQRAGAMQQAEHVGKRIASSGAEVLGVASPTRSVKMQVLLSLLCIAYDAPSTGLAPTIKARLPRIAYRADEYDA